MTDHFDVCRDGQNHTCYVDQFTCLPIEMLAEEITELGRNPDGTYRNVLVETHSRLCIVDWQLPQSSGLKNIPVLCYIQAESRKAELPSDAMLKDITDWADWFYQVLGEFQYYVNS